MNNDKAIILVVTQSNPNPGVKVAKGKQKKSVVRKPEVQEVLVYDCVNHEKVVAEFRGESKWRYSEKLYKVYHPSFKTEYHPEEYRWVLKIAKVLGAAGEVDEAQLARDLLAEKKIIDRLMK